MGETKHKQADVAVIAMHGWAGDSRCWRPWIEATAHLGWSWRCGERGYGEIQPQMPAWPENTSTNALRVIIGHSLGPHFLSPEAWSSADAVVLLASFGTFIPSGRAGRRLSAALDAMEAKSGNEADAREMLETFLVNAAHPEPPHHLPPSPATGTLDLDRLRSDLEMLRQCQGLPKGFHREARVLIVEAGADRIVDPEARAMLREVLPDSEVTTFPQAGHAFLGTRVVSQVARWVESLRREP
jgi:pimeloyl-[acyl-carrier protein] methyl ester esterase